MLSSSMMDTKDDEEEVLGHITYVTDLSAECQEEDRKHMTYVTDLSAEYHKEDRERSGSQVTITVKMVSEEQNSFSNGSVIEKSVEKEASSQS